MIFILFFFYLAIVAYISTQYRLSQKLFYFNAFLILMFISLRGYDNGSIDTIDYIDWLLKKGSKYSKDEDTLEEGYVWYIHFLRFFVTNGTVYLVINTTLSLIPLFYLIRKHSFNANISAFLFFLPLTNIHRMYFVCQRQILGLAFVLLGIILFEKLKRKIPKYIVFLGCSIIGFYMQHFAILLTLVYILMEQVKIRRNMYIGWIIITFIFGVFLGGIQNFSFLMDMYLNTGAEYVQLLRYSEVAMRDTNANVMQAFTSSMLGISFALYSKETIYNSIYAKLFLVSVIVLNLLSSAVEVYRIASFFTIFGLIVLPGMFHYIIVNKKNTVVTSILWLSILYSVYSYIKTLYSIDEGSLPVGFDSLVPYEFFWEDRYSY